MNTTFQKIIIILSEVLRLQGLNCYNTPKPHSPLLLDCLFILSEAIIHSNNTFLIDLFTGSGLGLGCGQPLIYFMCVRAISSSSKLGGLDVLRSGRDGLTSCKTDT